MEIKKQSVAFNILNNFQGGTWVIDNTEKITTILNNNFEKGFISEELNEQAFEQLDNLLEKAMSHKYFRREGTPGNYRYYYTEEEYKQAKNQKGEDYKSKETDIKDKYSKLEEDYQNKIKQFKELPGWKSLITENTIQKELGEDKFIKNIIVRLNSKYSEGKNYFSVDVGHSKSPTFGIEADEYYSKLNKIKEKRFDTAKEAANAIETFASDWEKRYISKKEDESKNNQKK